MKLEIDEIDGRYIIALDEETVADLGWDEGDELSIKKIIVAPKELGLKISLK